MRRHFGFVEGGVMDLSLFETVFIECRFRLRSAFDSFSVASEAFSETGRLIPGRGVDRRL